MSEPPKAENRKPDRKSVPHRLPTALGKHNGKSMPTNKLLGRAAGGVSASAGAPSISIKPGDTGVITGLFWASDVDSAAPLDPPVATSRHR